MRRPHSVQHKEEEEEEEEEEEREQFVFPTADQSGRGVLL